MNGRLPDRNFWRGRRVLVTGHSGFKGAWLWLALEAAGARPLGISLGPVTDPDLFRMAGIDRSPDSMTGDIRNQPEFQALVMACQPEIVLHLAAQSLVTDSFRSPAETYRTNLTGVVHLLEAVRACPGIRAVVVATTDKCYENTGQVWPYRESDPLGGHDPYSSSKACAEIAVSSWRRSFFRGTDAPGIATVRAGNVIGGGDYAPDRLVPDCWRAVIRGEPVRLRHPGAIRPWQHVLDPLCGYLLLAEALVADPVAHGRAWNFGPGDDDGVLTAQQLAGTFLAACGGENTGLVTGHPAAGTEASPVHEAAVLRVDSSLARTHLGWRPRLSTRAAVQKTAAWYREAGRNPKALSRRQIRDFFGWQTPSSG